MPSTFPVFWALTKQPKNSGTPMLYLPFRWPASPYPRLIAFFFLCQSGRSRLFLPNLFFAGRSWTGHASLQSILLDFPAPWPNLISAPPRLLQGNLFSLWPSASMLQHANGSGWGRGGEPRVFLAFPPSPTPMLVSYSATGRGLAAGGTWELMGPEYRGKDQSIKSLASCTQGRTRQLKEITNLDEILCLLPY